MKDEKILGEENLSEEELEQVSGGTKAEWDGDVKFLQSLGYLPKPFQCYDELRQAWREAGGINARLSKDNNLESQYFIGSEILLRKSAFRRVLRNRGWNWTAIDLFDWEEYGFEV